MEAKVSNITQEEIERKRKKKGSFNFGASVAGYDTWDSKESSAGNRQKAFPTVRLACIDSHRAIFRGYEFTKPFNLYQYMIFVHYTNAGDHG